MSLLFHPAIARGDARTPFPRPVVSLRLQQAWDSEKFKVPLRDGDRTAGHSQNGVDITIQGQVGRVGDVLCLSEESMLAALEDLRTHLHVGGPQAKFRLVLYGTPDGSDERYYDDVSTTRLDWDLSDQHLYTYTATLHADDPTLKSTTP